MADAVRTWFEVVDERRQELGLSQDDLAYAARGHGAPSTLTGSWISQLKRGKRPLAIDVLRGLAGALDLQPEVFVEYRLAVARRALDPREVGLDQAAANLTVLAGLVGGSVPGPPPGGELERLLKAESPTPKAQRRRHSGGRSKAAS